MLWQTTIYRQVPRVRVPCLDLQEDQGSPRNPLLRPPLGLLPNLCLTRSWPRTRGTPVLPFVVAQNIESRAHAHKGGGKKRTQEKTEGLKTSEAGASLLLSRHWFGALCPTCQARRVPARPVQMSRASASSDPLPISREDASAKPKQDLGACSQT